MGAGRCSVWAGLEIGVGAFADYQALHHFHYRSERVGAVTRIFCARYRGEGVGGSAANDGMVAGVLVETLPALGCTLRRIALPGRFTTGDRRIDAGLLNKEMRTIARVIVHPIFRGTGLGVELVRHVLKNAETRYVEALAAMGRVNPFFERAGMVKFDRPPLGDAVRLMAALERENLRPVDLVDPQRVTRTAFLESELKRFARKKEQGFEAWLAEARGRLLSQPMYYLWANNGN